MRVRDTSNTPENGERRMPRLPVPAPRTASGPARGPLTQAGVVALQRTAGNAAASRLIQRTEHRGASTGTAAVQRSVVDQATAELDDKRTDSLPLLNPKAAETNLWVTINGVSLKDLLPTSPRSLWPIQSRGQGAHAEEAFLEMLPLLKVKDGSTVALEINKTPCSVCTGLLTRAAREYPKLTFKLQMLGLYPGNARNQPTGAGDLDALHDAIPETGLLDLTPIAEKLNHEDWQWKKKDSLTPIKQNERNRARDFVSSVDKSLGEARGRLAEERGGGSDEKRTRYEKDLDELAGKFNELRTQINAKTGNTGPGPVRTGGRQRDSYHPYSRNRRQGAGEHSRDSTAAPVEEATEPAAPATAGTEQEQIVIVDDPEIWAGMKNDPNLVHLPQYDGNYWGKNYYLYQNIANGKWVYAAEHLPA